MRGANKVSVDWQEARDGPQESRWGVVRNRTTVFENLPDYPINGNLEEVRARVQNRTTSMFLFSRISAAKRNLAGGRLK